MGKMKLNGRAKDKAEIKIISVFFTSLTLFEKNVEWFCNTDIKVKQCGNCQHDTNKFGSG